MFTICLDPGHGGRDPGAVRGGAVEAAITLQIALAARRILMRKYAVALTRDNDSTVSLQERVTTAARARADLFVSIHVNAAQNAVASGYEILVRPKPSASSLALASAILLQFSKRWPTRRNRGLRERSLFVLRQARPACLAECFFLSNPMERALLNQASVRSQLAEAIAWGCGNFITMALAPQRKDL